MPSSSGPTTQQAHAVHCGRRKATRFGPSPGWRMPSDASARTSPPSWASKAPLEYACPTKCRLLRKRSPPMAGEGSRASRDRPRRNVVWMTSRGDAGMDCIDTWLWSCWPIVSSRCNGCSFLCLLARTFPPSVTRSSLPHVHRQVLLWLI